MTNVAVVNLMACRIWLTRATHGPAGIGKRLVICWQCCRSNYLSISLAELANTSGSAASR